MVFRVVLSFLRRSYEASVLSNVRYASGRGKFLYVQISSYGVVSSASLREDSSFNRLAMVAMLLYRFLRIFFRLTMYVLL